MRSSELSNTLRSRDGSTQFHINQSHDHPLANVLRDFSMEGLAILLPGFGFLSASIPAFWIPLFCFTVAIDFVPSDLTKQPQFFDEITRSVDLVSSFHIEFFIAITGISYMVGQILFRRDPKVPDFKSFVKIHMRRVSIVQNITRIFLRMLGTDSKFTVSYKNDLAREPDGNVLLRIWHHISTITIRKDSYDDFDGMARPPSIDDRDITINMVEFPYNYLHRYLEDRNFDELRDLVYWKDNPRWRSKYFINSLKINLEFLVPHDCRRIFINEGHVRLASSVWYGCEYIRLLSIIGVMMSIGTNVLLKYTHPSLVIVPTAILVASIAIQSSIELTFHYQRCREVFYVLQLALLASKRSSYVFSGLSISKS